MSLTVTRSARRAFTLMFALFAAASAALGDSPAESESLYARLGGHEKVTIIVGETIDHSVATPELKRSFEGVDVDRVKRLIVEQICELAGGGCRYTGETMRDVHAGLELTETEMYGLVEALRESMRQHGIGLRERNELLALLAPMKRDIVEK